MTVGNSAESELAFVAYGMPPLACRPVLALLDKLQEQGAKPCQVWLGDQTDVGWTALNSDDCRILADHLGRAEHATKIIKSSTVEDVNQLVDAVSWFRRITGSREFVSVELVQEDCL